MPLMLMRLPCAGGAWARFVLREGYYVLAFWQIDHVAHRRLTVSAQQSPELCVCDSCEANDCCDEFSAARVLACSLCLSQQLVKPCVDWKRPRNCSLLRRAVADE